MATNYPPGELVPRTGAEDELGPSRQLPLMGGSAHLACLLAILRTFPPRLFNPAVGKGGAVADKAGDEFGGNPEARKERRGLPA